MATEAYLIRVASGLFAPATEQDRETLSHVKIGKPIRVEFTQPRNYEFHKKYFAMLNFAYEHFDVEETEQPKWKGVTPQKSFDSFRRDVTILAGHYEAHYRIDGSVRIEAKSISFAKMPEDEFQDFYTKCVDVILKRILTTYTRADLDAVVDQLLLGFA